MSASSSGEARRIEGRRLYGNRLLEPGAYRLPDPAIVDLFTEAWKNSTLVRGAFGWFSAGWIAAFAHGIAEFLEHPDARIDLTIAPVLFAEEHDAITGALAGTTACEEDALRRVVQLLDEGASSPSSVTRYAVKALAWLVVTKRMTLRVAVPVTGSNYHPKVWLFEDGYDTVAIRGSANATSRALLNAIEHLDVDPGWRDRYRVKAYSDMVDAWAAGADAMLVDTYVLDADVLASKVKRFAPPQAPTRREYEDAVEEETPVPPPTDSFVSPLRIPGNLEWDSGPYRHQGDAVREWENAGRQGILAIATGGGKTKTSLIAATRLHREIKRPLLLVVAVPTEPLLNQWRGDLEEFAPETDIVMPSLAGGPKKRTSLLNRVLLSHLVADGNHVTIILTTFNLLGEAEFQNALSLGLGSNPDAMLIGDEVHGLGAEGFIGDPPLFFNYRLGLSATPDRYEEEETNKLVDYFGAIVHTFTLPQAQLAGALVGYRYRITRVAELTHAEVADYRAASAKVGRAAGSDDKKNLRAMLAQRRGILETAEAKYAILAEVLDELEANGPIRDTLIYCSSKQPEQLDRVCAILSSRGNVEYRALTDETSLPERDKALKDFGAARVHVLVAKRILDEGVNIPSTRTAILMASSSSKREWVQRRGRVLRRAVGKDYAVIYDIPALTDAGADLSERSHRLIVMQEHERLSTFNNESLQPELNNNYIRELRQQYLGARSA
jgi:superfamily II DNA or RNA helicase